MLVCSQSSLQTRSEAIQAIYNFLRRNSIHKEFIFIYWIATLTPFARNDDRKDNALYSAKAFDLGILNQMLLFILV